MARVPIGFTGRVKGGPARGGTTRQLRFYTDPSLAVAKQLFVAAAGGATQPLVMTPNAGIPRALAADRAAGDAFVTVAVGQTATFNVGDRVPVYNPVQGTVYRVVTAITPGTGRLDLDSALGVAFTVANATMVNATDMEGDVYGWADDATDTWLQVTELGSARVLAPVKVAAAGVPATIVSQNEGTPLANARGAINFIGAGVNAADDVANNRTNVTIGITGAGTEALPGLEVTTDTDTGFFSDGANVLSVAAGGKRVVQWTGVASAANYVAIQNRAAGSPPLTQPAGTDTNITYAASSKGTGAVELYTGAFNRLAFQAIDVASSVNYLQAVPNATGNPPALKAAGADTNVELWLHAKGTSGIVLPGNMTDFFWIQGGTGTVTQTAAGGSANVSINLVPKGTGVLQYKGATLAPGNGVSITTAEASLGSDVAITANTYSDGPSVSLAAGTWYVIAWATVTTGQGTGSPSKVTGKLWDGTTVEASDESGTYIGTMGSPFPATVVCAGIVSPGGTTTFKLSVTADTASTIKATAPDNGAGATASRIVAVKIG